MPFSVFVFMFVFVVGTFVGIFTVVDYAENGFFWWNPVAVAARRQRARRNEYIQEYLLYGYSLYDSKSKADDRLRREAVAAERANA